MNPHYIVSGETVRDARTGLTWQRSVPSMRLTWKEAKEYAAQFALDGGGWRLPTVKELISIVDYSRTNPAIDTEAFPNTSSAFFWSSTPYADDGGYAWGVDFNDGNAFGDNDAGGGHAVRCVR